MVSSSRVQWVRNFGSKMAAATSSGSSIMGPKRSSIPNWRALTRGLQYVSGSFTLSSFIFSCLIVGRSHPICTLVSACKMFVAWATGFITTANSDRNASSAGLNLWRQEHETNYQSCNREWCINFIFEVGYCLYQS